MRRGARARRGVHGHREWQVPIVPPRPLQQCAWQTVQSLRARRQLPERHRSVHGAMSRGHRTHPDRWRSICCFAVHVTSLAVACSLPSGQATCKNCEICTKGFEQTQECELTADAKCTACPAGEFKPGEGNKDKCQVCESGKFQDQTGGKDCRKCQMCPPGRGQVKPCGGLHGEADRVCDDCRAGRYADALLWLSRGFAVHRMAAERGVASDRVCGAFGTGTRPASTGALATTACLARSPP